MALRAVKPRRIHEEIVGQIREQIAEGLLKSGDQLPSERELSEKFQVSRASVREAIRALDPADLCRRAPGMFEPATGTLRVAALGAEVHVAPAERRVSSPSRAGGLLLGECRDLFVPALLVCRGCPRRPVSCR